MANWDLSSEDVYGAVAVMNFATRQWRCVLAADFKKASPVNEVGDLVDLSWLVDEF